MKDDKKYKLTDETVEVDDFFGHNIAYRIEAMKDFGDVKKGDKGGFVQFENNLSQEGDCWVYDNAKVSGNARVINNAVVCNNAKVYGGAVVCDYAKVLDNSRIFCHANVSENAVISGNSVVRDESFVFNFAKVRDAQISCEALVFGHADIYGDVQINDFEDYVVFYDFDIDEYCTWTHSNNMWKTEDFYGTGEELVKKAYNVNERLVRYYESRLKIIDEYFTQK